MSRIAGCFEQLGQRKALIPFVSAGDPSIETTVPLMHAMVDAGADIIELGVPFSDPMADGPVIQKASERALAAGMTLHRTLQMVREFRQQDNTTPVILMGYLNPFEIAGYQAFAREAAEAGVDGVLTVDMPPEEADDFVAALREQQIDAIFLLAPTTVQARIATIASHASGFVYYVSLKGVTGSSQLNVEAVSAKLDEIRKETDLPLGVGFGISNAEAAAAVASVADAVVVGSALVRRIEENLDSPEQIIPSVCSLLSELRSAIDTA